MDVMIIGAGVAGLAAAERLRSEDLEVCILEACEQVGGRIRTAASGLPGSPFELGAEFVHGRNNLTWDFLRRARLTAIPAGQGQWIADASGLRSGEADFSEMLSWLGSAKLSGTDLSLEDFLNRRKSVPHEWLLRQFVEGFLGADTRRVSMKWVIDSLAGDEESFRIRGGYGQLIGWLAARLEAQHVSIYLNTVVETIRWRREKVDVVAQTPHGQRSFRAAKVLVTVPLGVLKAPPGTLGAIRFDPPLSPARRASLAGLEMGNVVKVQLHFQDAFWSRALGTGDFGFLHSRLGVLRTWWQTGHAPILTGWTGHAVKGLSAVDIVESALRDLSVIFHGNAGELRKLLVDWRFHNWRTDPFARGSYSYTTVGQSNAAGKLAKPLGETLYFAGESLAGGAPEGTVHGAIDTGLRAAEQMLALTPHLA